MTKTPMKKSSIEKLMEFHFKQPAPYPKIMRCFAPRLDLNWWLKMIIQL